MMSYRNDRRRRHGRRGQGGRQRRRLCRSRRRLPRGARRRRRSGRPPARSLIRYMTAPFVHELRVRYGECDPQGIVFNANYLLYFDVAFTELWREAVGPWQEMVERGIDAVVAEANVRFRAPARYDDVLGLEARITRIGTTSLPTEIDVVRAGEVLV